MEFEFNTRYHAMLAEAINQANELEFIIDDILAAEHFRKENVDITEQAYFDYIEKKLQGNQLSGKCEALLTMPNVAPLLVYESINPEAVQRLLKEWRNLRNRFAHGLIVHNGSGVPVLYHKGYCYDIESHVSKFFQLNGQVLSIVTVLEKLKSEYNGRPVLLEADCDPDHPIYA